ncbi:recombinase family protein [Prescottella equi]|uniref:recombinase family protein n=1 Tax=Rhodococcus hoagii TaxID=43767 RepID=UPI000A102647|nr:recombinase family protein [Prescottella equi]ORJ97764.1 integrase [Prescottella equi]
MESASPGLRVLGRLRLSRLTDESTSIERQRETIQRWAESQGHTVVGWAEDADVSGAVDPFDTPQLGQWLNHRVEEYDVIAAWKLDRLGRNAIQLNKLFGWCLDHNKTLVSCSESIDLGSWAGRMLASVIAGLAEGELEAIRERAKGSRVKLRESARFAGGKPPFGYRKKPRPGGGWMLEIDDSDNGDESPAGLVQRIVADVLDGKPVSRVVSKLNDDGYRTPRDYYETIKSGKPSLKLAVGEKRASEWRSTALRNLLTNPALRGYVHHKGQVARGDDGMPLQLADEPLVDADEWEALQAIFDGHRERRSHYRRPDASPLVGLVFCYWCHAPLWHNRNVSRGHEYFYYRCPSIQQHERASMIPAGQAEKAVAESFLDEAGDLPVMERVWVPGDSAEQELKEATTALDDVFAELEAAKSEITRARARKRIAALDERISILEAKPKQEARWEYKQLGGTYRDAWESLGEAERWQLILKSGMTFAFGLTDKGRGPNSVWVSSVYTPEPLRQTLVSGVTQRRTLADADPHRDVNPADHTKHLPERWATMREAGIQGIETREDKTVVVLKTGERVEIPNWLDEIGISEITNDDDVRIVWTQDGRGWHQHSDGEWIEVPLGEPEE